MCQANKKAGDPRVPGSMKRGSRYELRRRRQTSPPSPANPVSISANEPGSGTRTCEYTALHPGFAKIAGQGFTPLGPAVPASATNTSPLNGSTVIECALVVVGRLTVWLIMLAAPASVTMSKNRVVLVPLLPVT